MRIKHFNILGDRDNSNSAQKLTDLDALQQAARLATASFAEEAQHLDGVHLIGGTIARDAAVPKAPKTEYQPGA